MEGKELSGGALPGQGGAGRRNMPSGLSVEEGLWLQSRARGGLSETEAGVQAGGSAAWTIWRQCG